MLVLAVGVVSVCWAAWILWSSRATRWMRVCAPGCVVLIAAVDTYWLWKIDALMRTAASDTPADRTRHLSDGFATAYTVWGIGHGVELLLLGVMTVMMYFPARSRQPKA